MISKTYDEILRSRNERDRLQSKIKNLEMQLIHEKEKYNAYPKVIQSIQKLSNTGINESDIIKLENIISMTGIRLYKNKSSIYKQNLMDDLQKYGNLKLAVKNLEDKKKKKINLKSGKKIGYNYIRNKKKRRNRQLGKRQCKNKIAIKYSLSILFKIKQFLSIWKFLYLFRLTNINSKIIPCSCIFFC